MKGNKRLKPVLIAAVCAICVVVGFVAVKALKSPSNSPRATITTLTFQSSGFTFNYPKDSIAKQLTSQDQKDGYIFWVNSPSGADPYQITVRSESGLQAASALAHISTTDMLLQNTRAANPKRYQEYKEETFSKYQIQGHDVIDIVFSYKNAQGTTSRQRLVIFVKDANTAYVVRAQSTATAFTNLNNVVFTPLITSIN